MIGKQILNYEIKSLLGEGGMGNVYLAEHTQLKRQVAIKSLHSQLVQNQSLRERFKNEASTMAHLQHPNIVALFDYVEEQDGLYLIMEYVDGIPLDDYIKNQSGPIPEQQTIKLFQGILKGFNYAHDQGIIHRDIKPSNIILTKKDDQAKILDFGIAKMLNEADRKLTKTGTQIGTIYYMSPEQVKGQPLDITSDIYSLGVTLFQMLTGHNPYSGMTTEFEIYNSIVGVSLPEASSIYPGVSKKMERIIAKATAKNPKDRYKTCQQFLDDLVSNKIENHIITPIPEVKNVVQNNVKIENTPPKVIKKENNGSKVFVIISVIIVMAVISFFSIKFLTQDNSQKNKATDNKVAVIETVEQYLIYPSMNLRKEPNTESEVIKKLVYGDKVTLIEGEESGPDSENRLWIKVKHEDLEGWIPKETRGQRMIAPQDYKTDFDAIFGIPFTEDSEYTRIQMWAFFEIMTYLKERNKLGEFKIYGASKEIRDKGMYSCAVMKQNNNPNEFNYAVILKSDSNNEVLLLSGDDYSGKVVESYTIPSNINYLLNFKEGASFHSYGNRSTSEESAYPGLMLIDEFYNTYGFINLTNNKTFNFIQNPGLELSDEFIGEIINDYCQAVVDGDFDRRLNMLSPYMLQFISMQKTTNTAAINESRSYFSNKSVIAFQPYSNFCIERANDSENSYYKCTFYLGYQFYNNSNRQYEVGYSKVVININCLGLIDAYYEYPNSGENRIVNTYEFQNNYSNNYEYYNIECY